jgi:hypothetical protein
MSHGHHYRLK